MWTPAQLPPHPSSVPTLTPLAQKVLAEIRKGKNGCAPNNVTGRRLHDATVPSPARCKQEFLTADDIFDYQSSRTKNWSISFPNRQDDEGTSTLKEFRPQLKRSFDSSFSGTNIHKLDFQEKNHPELPNNSNEKETTFHLRNTSLLEKYITCDRGVQKTSGNEELSPDMEFDDMEVCSNSFGGPLTTQNSGHLWPNDTNPSIKVFSFKPSFDSRQRNITFKEIKKTSPQRHQASLTNKLKEVEPTDQTLIIANVPKTKFKFESKLDKYRVTNSKISKNTAITSYFKPLDDLEPNEKCLDDRRDNLHKTTVTALKQEGVSYSFNNSKYEITEPAKENNESCEKIGVGFESAVNYVSVDPIQTVTSNNKYVGEHGFHTVDEKIGVVFESAVNYVSEDPIQTVNSNNKYVGEQCFHTVDDKKNVHEEPTYTSAALSLSEPIESLFVNTQDPIEEKSKCTYNERLDILNDANELSVELSIKPYQEQSTKVKSPNKKGADNLYLFKNETETKAFHETNQDHREKRITDLQTNAVSITDQQHIDIFKINQSVKEINGSESHFSETLQIENNVILPSKDMNLLAINSTERHIKQSGDDLCPSNNKSRTGHLKKYNKNQNQTNTKSCNIQDQNSIRINYDSFNRKLVKKQTNLKQSTLYDWKKCLPIPESNKYSFTSVKDKNKENYVKKALFKKPQAPVEEKYFKQTNAISESNTKLQSKKLKCEHNGINSAGVILSPKAGVNNDNNSENADQISLINPNSTKVKVKKNPRFVAPIASQQTPQTMSTDIPVQKYSITVMDELIAKEILKQVTNERPQKVLVTVTFKEGYSLLNKPAEPSKNSRCVPNGVIFLIHWSSSNSHHYRLPLLDVNTTSSSVSTTVHALFSQPQQVICFESQAVFMLLKDVFHCQNISKWFAHDPLIGCWLLDPDNPPKDFAEAALQLDMDKDLLTINAKADKITQACDLLPALDKAMESLEKKLLNGSLWTVFTEMEAKLTPLIAEMESSSILVDVGKLHNTAAILNRLLKQLEQNAHQLAGRTFQLNSHKQLREILFDHLKLDKNFNITIKQTEHGLKSTSESVLSQLKQFHPLPNIVLEYRHLQKVKSTYINGLIQHVKPDNTIGTTWEQVGAATGRITSKNPNLQAIPKTPVILKDGEKIYLRAVFKAREGHSFLAADFQQIEFRVFAHFSQDNTLLQAFREGGDIFQLLALRWLGEKGEIQREKTKRIVYSVMYGAGPQLLADYLHVDMAEATRIIRNFTDIFPCLRSLPQMVIAQCRTQGYVVTLSGRRRLFPNIRSTNYKLRAYSERQAINFLIQGSAADICKAAMLDCETAIRTAGLQARLLLQIHDELIWEVADHHLLDTARTVQEAMEHSWDKRLTLKVPVPVCVSAGKTQADMEPITEKTFHNE